MSFNLRRVSDHAGDMGGSSRSIKWKEDGSFDEVTGEEPTVDESMQVGSVTARSYSEQDYWLTTPVTKILETIKNDDVHYVRFKTGNSEYEWWSGKYPKRSNN